MAYLIIPPTAAAAPAAPAITAACPSFEAVPLSEFPIQLKILGRIIAFSNINFSAKKYLQFLKKNFRSLI